MNLRSLAALSFGLVLCAMALGAAAEAAEQPKPYSGSRPVGPIETLKELGQAFYGCFLLPPADQSRTGMEITVVFSITRSGDLQGEPRFTFASPNVTPEQRATYQRAINDAFKRCIPFPLSESFGGAIAGRPLPFYFTDPRGQRKA